MSSLFRVPGPVALSLLLAVGLAGEAGAGGAHAPGELLIKYKTGLRGAERASLEREHRLRSVRSFSFIGVEHVSLEDGATVEEAIGRLAGDPRVEFAEPNYEIRIAAVPDDSLFPNQYALRNTGQTGGTPGADIRAVQAWDLTTGSAELRIAVLDTGIDYTHPDLARNVWTNLDEFRGLSGEDDDVNGFVDDIYGYNFLDGNGDPFDLSTHGTLVSGIIAAVGNNRTGVTGVAWNSKLVALKFLTDRGVGTVAGAIDAVNYARMVGARLACTSWIMEGFSQAFLDAINTAGAGGMLFVVAAGNDGNDLDLTPRYPASYDSPYIISVAATNHHDALAEFSNFGAGSVDLAAPGVAVLSTEPGGRYLAQSGTSFAAAHVAGVCALVMARFPALTVLEVKEQVLEGVDPMSSLVGRLRTRGRLNAFRSVGGRDNVPPGQITDLVVTEPGSNTMGLAWTATGNDGASGRAAGYEIRYSTSPITDLNFDEAPPGPGPTPGVSGARERYEVSGLAFSTRYFFAIRAYDEQGNRGPVSNNAIGTTLGIPRLVVFPGHVGAGLWTGMASVSELNIINLGAGTLDYTIPKPELLIPHRAWARLEPLAKGEADHRVGPAVVEHAGGPDGYGYIWVDSDERGGPVFDWVDITSVGTPVPLSGDDQTSPPVMMGMNFPFYGSLFDRVTICTNGFLSFSDPRTPFSNVALPSADGVANMVAPLWTDFDFGDSPRVYTHHDGSRFIVSWVGLTHSSGGGPYTFQAVLHPSGEIRFQYLSLAGPTNTSTVGIQNQAQDVGLTVAFNTSYLRDRMAVLIRATPNWLTVTPASGRVRTGRSARLEVRFDASELPSANLAALIRIESNDPDRRLVTTPAYMHVVPAPDIALDPEVFDIGPVSVGDTVRKTLLVSNRGVMDLTVTDIYCDDPGVMVRPATLLVPPGSTRTLEVSCAPAGVQPVNATIVLRTNDVDEYAPRVFVRGEGTSQPVIGVDPESLAVTLATNQDTTATIRVSNTGGVDLNFSVAAISGGGAAFLAGSAAPGIGSIMAEGGSDRGSGPASMPVEGSPDGVFDPASMPAKGEPDRVFGPEPSRSGGPDNFGYTYIDSDEPGGPAFNWIDVRGIGTQIPVLGDDVNAGWFPIGFSFPFYDASFDSFRICTNGFVTFTSTLPTFINTSLPNPSASVPENLLAVLWDDLIFNSNSAYYHSDGTRLVIQFQDVPRLGETALNTFEIVLYADGTIVYQYLSFLAVATNSNTVGIQNRNRTDGLLVAFNTNYVRSGLAVRFQRPADFISVTPASGTVPPGGHVDLTVRLDATGLAGGVYDSRARITSNDPVRPVLDVPIRLTVLGVPDITGSPSSLDFGSVFIGYPEVRTLQIQNVGTDVLNVSNVSSSDPVYTPDVTSFSLPASGTKTVRVTFNPTAAAVYPATLTLSSNDPDTPNLAIAMTGRGVQPPVAAATPNPVVAALATTLTPAAKAKTKPLILQNSGGTGLLWNATATVSSAPGLPPAGVSPATPSEPLEVQAPKGDLGLPGPPTTAASGGPDGFGYRWIDSNEPSGPVFSWVDITAVGTRIPFTRDDQNSGPIALPFSFPFYGATFDSVRVCTNGWLSFTSRDSTYHNVALPNAGTKTPENLIAPFWDDLDFRTSGDVYHHYDGARFIVSYVGAPHWIHAGAPPGVYTFQVILAPNGEINFQYLSMVGLLNSATIGIQDGSKTVGLHVAHNTGFVRDSLRVRITRLPIWLSISPSSGVVVPGRGDTIGVQFDATGLEDGNHLGQILITSNDPARPLLMVSANLRVGVVGGEFRLDPDDPMVAPSTGWIAGGIEVSGICDPAAIRPASVLVAGEVPVAPGSPVRLDGCEAIFGFDRRTLLSALDQGAQVTVEVIGEVADVTWFKARDTLRFLPPVLSRPADPYPGGAVVALSWTDAPGSPPSRYDLWYSTDAGQSWTLIAGDLSGHDYAWTVPSVSASEAFLELVARAEADDSYVGAGFSGPFVVHVPTAAGRERPPDRLELNLVGANPARDGARLELAVPARGPIEVRIFDVRGGLVRRLAAGEFEAGRHVIRWDGRNSTGHAASPGVYFVQARSPWRSVGLRLALIR